MILREVKQYFQRVKMANLRSLSRQFNMSPDAMQPLLSLLVVKGHIEKSERPAGCGSRCTQCDPHLLACYRWCR